MPAKKKGEDGKGEREKRLAAELRANLARRKAQARSRRTEDAERRDKDAPARRNREE